METKGDTTMSTDMKIDWVNMDKATLHNIAHNMRRERIRDILDDAQKEIKELTLANAQQPKHIKVMCTTCLHYTLSGDAEPCRTCFEAPELYTLWEYANPKRQETKLTSEIDNEAK